MRRTLVTLGVVGLFAACGFPSVTYDTSDGGGEDASHTDAPNTTEGSSGDDARDGTTGDDGASSGGDASEAGDASFGDGEASTGTDAAGDGSDSSSGEASTGTDAAGDASDSTRPATRRPMPSTSSPPTPAPMLPWTLPPTSPTPGPTRSPVCDFDRRHVLAGRLALTCEADHDGYKSMAVGCNGNDCCDTDANAHPGVTAYFTAPDACGSFDYNCNGKVDAEYATNVTCSGNGPSPAAPAARPSSGRTPGAATSGTYQSDVCRERHPQVRRGQRRPRDPGPPPKACDESFAW